MATKEVDEQSELMTGLLEGADPAAYVVMPIDALTTQVLIAIRETVDREGRVRPGRTAMRLARSLSVLGFVIDTKHMVDQERRPHSRACGIVSHDHGYSCAKNCPTCHGQPL